VVRARRRWIREQGLFDPARLVFIDETATSTNMVRLRGRCPRGVRLVGYAPHGHWKTITFVAGLRYDRMVAPFVMEGAMDGLTFVEWVRQFLVPTLKRRDVVIMDNLPSHKVPGVREAIESADATLRYLPQYSPDLNPIENCFSKIKAHLRKAGCRPKCGWNYNWHNLRETNYSILCGEFKWLIDGLCGKTLPAIDLAHVDLAGSKERPEQHGSRVRRRQHGLRLDPALELLV